MNYLNANENIFGEVIYSYTQDEAIEDGVLVVVGHVGKERVIFTANLLAHGYEDDVIGREELVKKGLALLRNSEPEDTPTKKFRVVEKNKIWLIWNVLEGFVFMKPEDY